MNLYFILEGETEVKLYPILINHVLPQLTQVYIESDVKDNNFYIFSGGGIPSIYNHTVNAIKNINDNPVFDRLIVCLDGEEIGVEARIREIDDYILNANVELNHNCKINYIIQNICIESWFLGNRKIVKRNPVGEKLKSFKKHFDVIKQDPEEMDKMDNYKNKAHFHVSYFKEILKEHNLTYSKSNPKVVTELPYIVELINRVRDTSHLSTFDSLLKVLNSIT